ncbi:hypothetical protein [Pedobacter aquatilis]|uniref:hypothetical protein n=1 Tax=Pedobacter aquatilis TaxID=351343 RepID=UPI00292DF57C|nr:hypothetical protein [Pedobacter aquatilis]
MKGFISIIIIFFLCNHSIFAAVGCKVIGGTTVYPTYNTYVLGVIVNGINIGVPADVYRLNNPFSTTSSCTTSWVNSYQVVGSCVYGSPAVSLPPLVSVCTNCVAGELVNYNTTVECSLDGYSWVLGTAAGIFGVLIIKRRSKD